MGYRNKLIFFVALTQNCITRAPRGYSLTFNAGGGPWQYVGSEI